MRQLILVLTLLLICLACQPSKEEINKSIVNGIKAKLEKMSTKNSPIVLYEVKVPEYEEVGENRLDTLRRLHLADVINSYDLMIKENIKNSDDYKISSIQTANSKDLSSLYTKFSKESLERNISYQDSLKKYKKIDSAITARIKHRIASDKNYYLVNAYIKSVSGKQINRDTVQVVLTKDFKVFVVK